MGDLSMDNPMVRDVKGDKHDIVSEIISRLESKCNNMDIELRIYTDEDLIKSYGKYIIMAWDDPYTIGISFDEIGGCVRFKLTCSDFDTTELFRTVVFNNIIIAEFEYFIDTVDKFHEHMSKVKSVVGDYNGGEIPLGYLRDEKIDSILA